MSVCVIQRYRSWWSLTSSLCISHSVVQFHNYNKQKGGSRKPRLASLIINIYEDIWIMWFCSNKISFGGRKSGEREGEECEQAEEEEPAELKLDLMTETQFGCDRFSRHGDTFKPSELFLQSRVCLWCQIMPQVFTVFCPQTTWSFTLKHLHLTTHCSYFSSASEPSASCLSWCPEEIRAEQTGSGW